MINHFRVAPRVQKRWPFEKIECPECKSVMNRTRLPESDMRCPTCRKVKTEKLKRGQQTLVLYLIMIIEKQARLEHIRGGINGILVASDKESLLWTILEYRRLRTLKWLGMYYNGLNRAREASRIALKCLGRMEFLENEIQDDRLN